MTPALLSIGAGPSQHPLLAAAHALGAAVVAVDRAPSDDCRPFLTDVIEVSTHDADGVLDALAPLRAHFSFSGVLARTSGPALVTASRAAAFLDVPGISPTFAQASLNKAVLREQARALGIATPQGRTVTAGEGLEGPGPWIVKPAVPLRGKENVYRVDHAGELADAIAAAATESVDGRAECQDYCEGADVTAMCLAVNGKQHAFALIDEFVSLQAGRAKGLGVAAPSVLSGLTVAADIREIVVRLMEHFEIKAGFSFFSFRVPPVGAPLLYEANPGLCGDAIADRLLPSVYGDLDPFRAEVLAILERDVPLLTAAPVPSAVLDGGLIQAGDAVANLDRLAADTDGAGVAATLRQVARERTAP